MRWFTSTRERRLWAWALTLLAAIYLAAFLAGSLVEAFGSQGLIGVFFAVGVGLAVAAVVGIALDRRPRTMLWVAIGVAASYVMIPVRSGVSALERTHLFEYGLLAVLLYEALVERRRNKATVRWPALGAVVVAAALGWLDEAVQRLVATRVYDLRDVAVDAVAAAIAVAIVAVVRWVRARRAQDAASV